jgi:type IV pilus biogenesis protein CpaD/CtpE
VRNLPVSVIRRLLTLGLVLLVTTTALAGCTSEDEQAADALCTDFRWDSSETDEENSRRMSAVMNRYDYPDFRTM